MELSERFEQYEDEFLKFERIESPKHRCRDICAFLMLDELAPRDNAAPIVMSSEHDEFYLSTDCDALNSTATDEQIRDLRRCGVMYSDEYGCLSMFS